MLLDKSVKELSDMQLGNAKDILRFVPSYIDIGDYSGAISRSYYAAFHALKALELLDGFDAKKHSGVIAYFRQHYIKTGLLDKELSTIIGRLQEARGFSDYDVSMRFELIDAEEAFNNATKVVNAIEDYLAIE